MHYYCLNEYEGLSFETIDFVLNCAFVVIFFFFFTSFPLLDSIGKVDYLVLDIV